VSEIEDRAEQRKAEKRRLVEQYGGREISDARTLRALSHPVRLALIETLTIGGVPMTATELGEEIGETPTTCSFHLRQLAKYGFVEEAGGGKGRARPWRMSSIGMSFGPTHGTGPEYEIAARTLTQMYRERSIERHREWMDSQASYPARWREAAENSEYVFYLTAEELEELNHEVEMVLVNRYLERLSDPSLRPPGSVPVEMLFMSWPLQPPEADADADADDADEAGQ
jgi:DNA-binding transcriptional ArsR family regulator